MASKPSFFSSIVSGITGYGSGLLRGLLIGVGVGAILGAGALLIPGAALAAGGASVLFASITASVATTFASIGALSGLVTNIIKGREAEQPTTQDIVNIANLSFAQGVAAGKASEPATECTKFRDQVMRNRELAANAQKTLC